jgi:folylpolyglutamate synthase/dihydrofolate synthase
MTTRALAAAAEPALPPFVVGEFLDLLGRPSLRTPTVHVTGTKGKGSVCAVVARALQVQGYRTGAFTKPSLHCWREHATVDGEMMSLAAVEAMAERLEVPVNQLIARPDIGRVTSFQFMVAMALQHFQDMATDVNVVEVGTGGRRDATNVVNPAVSVLTSIGPDHLGNMGWTVEEVAQEKSGIIKPGAPVVCSPQVPSVLEILRAAAAANGSRLVQVLWDVRWRPGRILWEAPARAASAQARSKTGSLQQCGRAVWKFSIPAAVGRSSSPTWPTIRCPPRRSEITWPPTSTMTASP